MNVVKKTGESALKSGSTAEKIMNTNDGRKFCCGKNLTLDKNVFHNKACTIINANKTISPNNKLFCKGAFVICIK